MFENCSWANWGRMLALIFCWWALIWSIPALLYYKALVAYYAWALIGVIFLVEYPREGRGNASEMVLQRYIGFFGQALGNYYIRAFFYFGASIFLFFALPENLPAIMLMITSFVFAVSAHHGESYGKEKQSKAVD